jgi:protein phosphatase
MQIPATTRGGPFDIVGDVHGCLDELLELMAALGYGVERVEDDFKVTPPTGRTLAFVGDLVNRGPATAEMLRLVMGMTRAGQALAVAGNHDIRLLRALTGGDVEMKPDLLQSLDQLRREPEEFRSSVIRFLGGLASHLILDEGRLVIAHAGLKEEMIGSDSDEARAFALTGEVADKRGVAVRVDWAAEYRGQALVVFGHTPVTEPLWVNQTVNIDTGCVYGGRLTALRYPEREVVSVRARAAYHPSRKGFQVNEALARAAENF